MADQGLLEITTRKLAADAPSGATWPLLVLAAFGGESALIRALEDGQAPALEAGRLAAAPRAFLTSIAVEGFRGIGPPQTLRVRPGPGLTLVLGRNGSGKSSFAEALELLLTGANWRWAERSKVWRDGWRNLHHNPTRISATFAVEGVSSEMTLAREWADGADLDAASAWSQVHGEPRASLDEPGWTAAAETYRPILSYNELGSMFDEGPTALHDRLARILGLGEIDRALKLLRDQRLLLQRELKEIDQGARDLIPRLEEVDDPRARAALGALAKKRPDTGAIQRLVASASDEASNNGVLKQLSVLVAPDPEAGAELSRLAAELISRHKKLQKSAAFGTQRLVQILRLGLQHYEEHGAGACPLCGSGGTINATWADAAVRRVQEAEAVSSAVENLQGARTKLLNDVRILIGTVPPTLSDAAGAGIDDLGVTELWAKLSHAPEHVSEVARHLEPLADLVDRVGQVRRAAAKELERREAAWRPVAHEIAGWLVAAQRKGSLESKADDLQAAEGWLKRVSAEVRRERFMPIAERSIQLWDLLRQQSSVELNRVMLEGTGTMRRVALDVTIDGVDGAALGVMSQGELHAMALSLFMPRAALEESPFRFMVIDDPVQSMDPARVDGLARVLAGMSAERQLLVFTHDDRLSEAMRRLGLDAEVIEVARRRDSRVTLRSVLDPVERYLSDGRAMAKADDVPETAAKQVVPSLCRFAIEAACVEVARRRRIGRGEAHTTVEDLLASYPKTAQRMALALFDDPSRAGDVADRIRSWGHTVTDAYYGATKGAHKGFSGDLRELVQGTETLCNRITQLS